VVRGPEGVKQQSLNHHRRRPHMHLPIAAKWLPKLKIRRAYAWAVSTESKFFPLIAHYPLN
jgi:hypothetical protein